MFEAKGFEPGNPASSRHQHDSPRDLPTIDIRIEHRCDGLQPPRRKSYLFGSIGLI